MASYDVFKVPSFRRCGISMKNVDRFTYMCGLNAGTVNAIHQHGGAGATANRLSLKFATINACGSTGLAEIILTPVYVFACDVEGRVMWD